MRRAVVVGGGAVGALFAGLLTAAGTEVSVVDPSPGPGRVAGDVTAPSARVRGLLTAADAVVLAVPEPVALAALGPLRGLLAPGALLVDTLSVKSPYAEALAGFRSDVELLGLNPMFAPSLGFDGRPVAAVGLRPGPRSSALLELVAGAGARVVVVSADRHDRLAAATQALTHAAVLSFGLALSALEVPIDELAAVAPPPHATLLALLARIAGGTPEVYWDVQSANPHAAEARGALTDAVAAVEKAVSGGEEVFTAALADARALLAHRLPHYGDLCARSFAAHRG